MAETITSDSEKQQPFETRVRPCRALCDTGIRGQPVCRAGLGLGPPQGLYYEALQSSLIPHTVSGTLASVYPCFLHMFSHVISCVSNDFLPQTQGRSKLENQQGLRARQGSVVAKRLWEEGGGAWILAIWSYMCYSLCCP